MNELANNCSWLAVVVALTIVSNYSFAEDKFKWDAENQKVFKDNHQFLFSVFKTRSPKFVVDPKQPNLVTEVVVFKRTVKAEKESKLTLVDGSNRVAAFFDLLVVEGVGLKKEVVGCTIRLPNASAKLRAVKWDDDEIVWAIPKLPMRTQTGKREMVVEITTLQGKDAFISQVLFQSKKGVSKDYSVYQKFLLDLSQVHQPEQYRNTREAVLSSSFEQLSASMGENTFTFVNSIYPAKLTSGQDLVPLNGIVSDRRVSKLYEVLSRMDEAEASKVALKNFDSEFERYKNSWGDEKNTLLPANNHHGMESHIFLCSEFCSPEELISKIDSWKSWYEEEKKWRDFQFEVFGVINPVYELNLLANQIGKEKNLSTLELNVWLAVNTSEIMSAGGTKPPSLVQKVLPTSDWVPNQVGVLSFIPVLENSGGLVNPKKREKVLQLFKKTLLEEN